MARSSCSYGSVGKSRPVSALTTFLNSADERLEVVDRQVGVAGVLAVGVLPRLEGLVEALGLHVHDDPPEHLDEAAVGVPAEALVAGELDQAVEGRLVEAEVQDGVHHPGHRELGAGADAHEERIGGIAEALAGPLLDLAHRLEDVVPEAVGKLLAGREVVVAGGRGDREAGRRRQARLGHLGEARALAAEQVLHPAVALGRALAPGVDVALGGLVGSLVGGRGFGCGHAGGAPFGQWRHAVPLDRCGAQDCSPRGGPDRRHTDPDRYHRGVIETDERVILPDAPQYNASLLRREDAHESLSTFWVKFDGDATPFESGQYMTIGVFVEDPSTPTGTRIVQRPYSVASDPGVAGTEGYEMYVRLVEGGLFTPLLWRLPVGHRMRMIGPKGKFTLEPDDDRTHLFISSGTGNAPFVSMMKRLLREGAPRKAVFLNGVSYQRDLGYRDLLEGWEASGGYPVTFIPTVSRPQAPENDGWSRADGPGRVDRRAGLRRARPHPGQHDRLHLRQPGHDPRRRGDAPGPRLPRAAGQEGALLAEGQGAHGRRHLDRRVVAWSDWLGESSGGGSSSGGSARADAPARHLPRGRRIRPARTRSRPVLGVIRAGQASHASWTGHLALEPVVRALPTDECVVDDADVEEAAAVAGATRCGRGSPAASG